MDVGGGRGEAMDARARGTWPMARRGSGAHRWFRLARTPPGVYPHGAGREHRNAPPPCNAAAAAGAGAGACGSALQVYRIYGVKLQRGPRSVAGLQLLGRTPGKQLSVMENWGRPGLGSAYRSVRKCILHQKAIAGVCKDAAQGVGRAASASAKSEKSEKLELEGTASANKEHQLRRMKRKRHTMDGAVKARVKLRVHLSARAHASSAAFQSAFA